MLQQHSLAQWCQPGTSLGKIQSPEVGLQGDQIVNSFPFRCITCMFLLKLFWKLRIFLWHGWNAFRIPKYNFSMTQRNDHNNNIHPMNYYNLAFPLKVEIFIFYYIRVYRQWQFASYSKPLITSMRFGSGKNKELGFSGNCCIGYHIIISPSSDLIFFNIFLNQM